MEILKSIADVLFIIVSVIYFTAILLDWKKSKVDEKPSEVQLKKVSYALLWLVIATVLGFIIGFVNSFSSIGVLYLIFFNVVLPFFKKNNDRDLQHTIINIKEDFRYIRNHRES